MFYQNSNDLVKNASVRSGHIQNSSGTREALMRHDFPSGLMVSDGDDSGGGSGSGSGGGSDANASLSIGAKFQNMIQGLIDSVSLKEGIDGAAVAGGGGDAAIAGVQKQTAEHTQQQLDHIVRVGNIMKLIDEGDKNSRQKWVEVTDSAGVTKYGYITKDGIFQIWNAPASPPTTDWFQTDKIKQNAGVLGCPAAAGSIQKHKIAGTWETIKPFDMVYAADDSGRKNPLFLLVNDAVRDPKNSVNGKGLFSCGNERGNVYVAQRPSADFNVEDPIKMGCYVIADNVKDIDITNRGFTFQDDLTEASISQCKRRAEDLGSSYFLVSAPQPGKPNNRGGCWIYTGNDKLETAMNGFLTLNNDETKCHTVRNAEDDEDGFMKAYTTTTLKRMYGKTNVKSSTDYTSKGDGFWPGEGPNQYACSGAKGRNTTGNYGDFNRYCIFDKAQDAENWCSSDPNCIGYTNMRNQYYQATKKNPDVTPHGGSYFVKSTSSRPSQSVALYSLKSGGPTGVDKNGRDSIGKIAYIDHNGERHEYPASALSFMAPSKNAAGETLPASYVNLGGYDTRSAESSYGLKELTPGSFSDAANPPDYERRLRTMPVGESITASMEKCRGMCDADEKCGGFVYTKSGSSANGKCELKDRAKMYPNGLRVADPTKQLMLKVPTINGTIADDKCKVGNGKYAVIDSAQYAHYPDTGAMSAGTKCKINDIIPSNVNTPMPDITQAIVAVNKVTKETAAKTAEYRAQTTATESFTGFREGMAGDISGGNYADTMTAVQRDLKKIANAEYQRERIHAMTEESNKLLIAESYKFILWSILAILAVMALLKLKEMFGQDDVDADEGSAGEGSGGLFAYILGLFGVGSVKTDDIADRTGDVKEALSSAGEQLKEAGENLTTGITEGADNLVSSANEAAAGAVEGARGLADKVSETATDVVNKVGDAVGSAAGAPPATGAGTGGRGRHTRNSGKK